MLFILLRICATVVIILLFIKFAFQLRRLWNRKPFVWYTNGGNAWAVVTGAGSGMGFEFSRQLALKGYNLLLLSLYEHELENTKTAIQLELKQLCKPPVRIETLAVDFSRVDIYDQVGRFLGASTNDIFVLVNNVGVTRPIPDCFLANSESDEFRQWNRRMINVNVGATTNMIELVLPFMVRRKRGLVINVASIVGRHIVPLQATYGATKVMGWVGFFGILI